MVSATYELSVDWDNDGDYGDTGEDVSARVRAFPGITCIRGRDQLRNLSPPMAGVLEAALDNQSQDYSPENGGSPLTGYLLPGRPVRLRATYTPTTSIIINGSAASNTTLAADDKASCSITPASTIHVTTIGWYLGRAGGTYNYRFGIYSNLSSAPARLLASTGSISAAASTTGTVTGTLTVPFTMVSGTVYWIVCQADNSTTVYFTATGGDHADADDTFSDGLEDPFGAVASSGTRDYNFQLSALTTHNLWQGTLDDLPQHPDKDMKLVEVPSLGNLAKIRGKKVTTQFYESITTGTAIQHVLTAVGLTSGDWTLSTGQTTLQWWWLDDEEALSALVDLLNSEGPPASIYEGGDGKIVFEDRHYRSITSRSQTSQHTFSDTGSESLFTGFRYDPGLKDIINDVVVEIKLRSKAADATVIWDLDTESFSIGALQARRFIARQSNGEPFANAIEPLAGTDFTVSSGTIITESLEDLQGNVLTGGTDSASGSSIVLVFTAGASGATITDVQLRAKRVAVDEVLQITSTDSTSQTNYGKRTYEPSIKEEISINDAQALCDGITTWRRNPRPIVEIDIVAQAHDTRMTQSLIREISDQITIVEAQAVLNSTFYIERIKHKIDNAGLQHVTTFGCERITPLIETAKNLFLIGTSELNGGDVVWF